MDLGLNEDTGPRDAIMIDPSATSLKRARCPPKSSTSNCPNLPLTKASPTPTMAISNQVSPPNPCMAGGRVDGISKYSTPSSTLVGASISSQLPGSKLDIGSLKKSTDDHSLKSSDAATEAMPPTGGGLATSDNGGISPSIPSRPLQLLTSKGVQDPSCHQPLEVGEGGKVRSLSEASPKASVGPRSIGEWHGTAVKRTQDHSSDPEPATDQASFAATQRGRQWA